MLIKQILTLDIDNAFKAILKVSYVYKVLYKHIFPALLDSKAH